MFLLRYLRLLWSHAPRDTALLLAATIIANLTDGVGLLLLVPVISALGSAGAAPLDAGPLNWIWDLVSPTTLIILFPVLIMLRSAAVYARTVLGQKVRLDTVQRLRVEVFSALQMARADWSVNQSHAEPASLMFQQVQRVAQGVNASLTLLWTLIMVLVHAVIAIALSAPLAALTLIGTAFLVYGLRHQHRRSDTIGQALNQSNKAIHQTIHEGIGALRLSQISGIQRKQINRIRGASLHHRDQQLEFARLSARMTAVFQVVVALFLCAVLLLCIYVTQIPAPVLILFVVLIARTAPGVQRALTQANLCLFSWPSYLSIQAFLEEAGRNGLDRPDSAELPRPVQGVFLDRIRYQYSDRADSVLQDVSLSIPTRGLTIVTGTSGAGKSTLADIIMGLRFASVGAVRIDTVDLTPETALSWHKHISYVPQDPFLFAGTIRDNLSWVSPDATEGDMIAALSQAAASFVLEHPDGLDIDIGDNGTSLSGGERQRIAIARSLLANPALIVLDEPTSGLDAENTRLIWAALETLARERAVLVMTHELPQLSGACAAYALDQGRLRPCPEAGVDRTPDRPVPDSRTAS